MSNQIQIIALRMGELPKVEVMDKGLDAMQAFVEGMITCVGLSDGCDLWCNDEGLYTHKPNRHVMAGRFSQVIHGPMFIAAHDGEGETVSLTDDQCREWLNESNKWPRAMTSLAEGDEGKDGEILLIM